MKWSQKVLFEFDCGADSGYGHLARVLAVAESMKFSGCKCFFASNTLLTDKARQMIRGSGLDIFEHIPSKFDLHIIDKYSKRAEIFVGRANKVIQFVDQSSPDLDADAYVSVSPTNNWTLQKNLHKPFLNDPPLRTEVIKLAGQDSFPSKNNRILFLFGGANQALLKNSVIQTVREHSSKMRLDILVNPMETVSSTRGTNIDLVVAKAGLMNVISDYEMIVSACGVSAWELLALRKRVCFYSLIDNQDFQLAEISKLGHNLVLEMDSDRSTFKNLTERLENLMGKQPKSNFPLRLDGAAKISEFILNIN